MQEQVQQEVFQKWFGDNPAAIDLVNRLAGVSQIWDDLVDRDKRLSIPDINGMMLDALINIPSNPFFQAHSSKLLPVMESAIHTWFEANDIEQRGDLQMLRVSYISRSAMTPVIMYVIGLIGGVNHRLQAAQEILPLIFDEPIEGYLDEHFKEKADGVQ